MDSPFRLLLIVAVGITIVVAGYHRVRAASTRERLDRRQEGLFILIAVRTAGLALWAAIITYMISPRAMAWSSIPLSADSRWAGVVVWIVAVGFLFWTLRSLGKNLTDTVVTREGATLVTHGPYRWIRHPFYDALVLIVIAATLLMANWFVFAAGATAFVLLAVRSRKEEERLAAKFGDAYLAYRNRTGKFLPRLT